MNEPESYMMFPKELKAIINLLLRKVEKQQTNLLFKVSFHKTRHTYKVMKKVPFPDNNSTIDTSLISQEKLKVLIENSKTGGKHTLSLPSTRSIHITLISSSKISLKMNQDHQINKFEIANRR